MFEMKVHYAILIICGLFFCKIFATSVPIRPCKANVPTAIEFVSEGCIQPPCPLFKGTQSNANITFRIPKDTQTSSIKIRAQMEDQNWWLSFPPPDKNVCHSLVNSYCPLDENEHVTYHLGINVLPIYPTGLGLDLEISFLDEELKTMMCMKIKCKVVAS